MTNVDKNDNLLSAGVTDDVSDSDQMTDNDESLQTGKMKTSSLSAGALCVTSSHHVLYKSSLY